jgi:hypothetical protein
MATVGVFERNGDSLRGHDAARLNYLHRLSHQQVWVPRSLRAPRHQTVIIFDWDDTLLCTSWLNRAKSQGVQLTPAVRNHIRGIEREVTALLELAMQLGHVFIITNAMEGWVEFSTAQWAPGLMPILERVPIISARTRFETKYPTEVGKWKIEAFFEVKNLLPGDLVTNLVSVGDAQFEMDAVHAIGKEYDEAIVKTVKFREHPTPEELIKQLELVTKQFQRIVENGRNLKIGLERKQAAA